MCKARIISEASSLRQQHHLPQANIIAQKSEIVICCMLFCARDGTFVVAHSVIKAFCKQNANNHSICSSSPQKVYDFLGTPIRRVKSYISCTKRKTRSIQMDTTGFWCERRDLNPYESPHTPLKRARLPIPPLSRQRKKL